MPHVPITAPPSVVQFEADLRAPVAGWLEATLGPAVLADELDLGFGAPDLVAGIPARLAERVASGVGPITDPAQVFALDALRTPATEAALRTHTSSTWSRYRGRVIEPLAEQGLLAEENGVWQTALAPIDVFPALVAVELKLRDWRRAIAQAARYRAFARTTFIAMPERRLPDAALEAAAARGVGVLAIGESGAVCVVAADDLPPLDERVRTLASELVLASFLGLRENLPAGSPRGQRPAALVP